MGTGILNILAGFFKKDLKNIIQGKVSANECMAYTWTSCNKYLVVIEDWAVSLVIRDIAVGATGLEFDSLADRIGHCRLTTAAMFLRSCVAQTPSCGDGSRCSLHALA